MGGAGVFHDLGLEAKATFQLRGNLPGIGDWVNKRGQRGFVGIDGKEDGVVFARAETSRRTRPRAGSGTEQGKTQQEENGGLSHHLKG